jgi:hypothetical protein
MGDSRASVEKLPAEVDYCDRLFAKSAKIKHLSCIRQKFCTKVADNFRKIELNSESSRICSDGEKFVGFCMMRSNLLAASAIAASAVLFAQPAFANVITIDSGTAQVTCTLSCEAFTLGGSPGAPTGLGTLSGSDADPYGLANSNPSTEVAALNTLAGTSFTTTDHNKVDVGGASTFSFMTFAEYFILKVGSVHTFFKNTAGNEVTVEYLQTGSAGGLSHYSEVGQVPLPAALWLMGAGLAGLGFASRKNKAKA